MRTNEKKAFIVRLIANVQAAILADVPRMPAEWDGTKLREHIAERFARIAKGRKGKP